MIPHQFAGDWSNGYPPMQSTQRMVEEPQPHYYHRHAHLWEWNRRQAQASSTTTFNSYSSTSCSSSSSTSLHHFPPQWALSKCLPQQYPIRQLQSSTHIKEEPITTKHPLNGFMLYCQESGYNFNGPKPWIFPEDATPHVAIMWYNMSEKQRKNYSDRAKRINEEPERGNHKLDFDKFFPGEQNSDLRELWKMMMSGEQKRFWNEYGPKEAQKLGSTFDPRKPSSIGLRELGATSPFYNLPVVSKLASLHSKSSFRTPYPAKALKYPTHQWKTFKSSAENDDFVHITPTIQDFGVKYDEWCDIYSTLGLDYTKIVSV